MMTFVKYLLLITAFFSTAACNDKLEVQFRNHIDDQIQAEKELQEALDGIAMIDEVKWISSKKVKIKLTGHEDNTDFSMQHASDIIQEKHSFTNNTPFMEYRKGNLEFNLVLEITEQEEDVLNTFSLVQGQQFSSKLDWSNATMSLFYKKADEERYPYNSYSLPSKDFFCAVSVPLDTNLPNLNFTRTLPEEKKAGMSKELMDLVSLVNSFDTPMVVEHTKSITGLPIGDE